MTLGLDLSSCDAKLARAREHVDALEREATVGIAKESPYAVRFSEVDPQTGWCSITLVPDKAKKPRFGAIFGDVIHNLRSALDYVVTALVDASQTNLTTSHQFPIFKDEALYASVVGSKTQALSNGPLRGIIHGLAIVEGWQPYYTKPDPRTDPLWGIHRFSNADKHREPATFAMIPVGQLDFDYRGVIVEKDPGEDMPDWTPDKEIPCGRVRFDPPYAYNLRAKGKISLDILFVTPPFGSDADLTISLKNLRGTVARIAQLLDTFRQL